MRPSGLTATQFAVLQEVEREGLVPMSHIAESLVMDRTTLYRAVNPLLRDGVLSYAPGGTDARAKYLIVTRAGKKRMARAAVLWEKAQQNTLGRIGEGRWRRISAELVELATLVDGQLAPSSTIEDTGGTG